MNLKTRSLLALPCLAAVLAVTSVAHANTISGTAYCGVSNTYAIQTPVISSLAAAIATTSGACATFTASTINFATNAGTGTDTLGGFLNSFGAASGITYAGGASAATSFDGTLMVLTGSTYLTNGETITLSHDDGVNVYLNGTALVLAGTQTVAGQAPFTFNGATGNYNFEVIYTSNYLAPAVLQSNIANVAPVPEPSTLMMLGTGLFGLAGAVRRKLSL